MDNHQANLKMLVHIVQKLQCYGIPFIFINSLYNYYQLLDVLSVVSCDEILLFEYYEYISKLFLVHCQPWNLKIIEMINSFKYSV